MKGRGSIFIGIFFVVLLLLGIYFWYLRDQAQKDSLSVEQEAMKEKEKSGASIPPVTNSNPKKLRVIAPNGGEVWSRAKQYNVSWVSDLPASTRVKAIIFKTNKVILDPYLGSVVAGREMFGLGISSAGEGSYTYIVPSDLTPGTYQVLLWGGEACSSASKVKRCEYDLSNKLFTIR